MFDIIHDFLFKMNNRIKKIEPGCGSRLYRWFSSSISIGCHQLQPSTFNHQPSTFNHQPSTINFQPSTFNLQPPTFNLQPSTFNLELSTFNLQPSTFNLFPSATPAPDPGR